MSVESAMSALLSITDAEEVEEMIYDFKSGAVFHDAEVAHLLSIVAPGFTQEV